MVHIYTDGSCLGNPGPGGWACILKNNYKTKELSGGSPYTTNNQMELTAVIEGLKALKNAKDVNIYTDSQYVQKAFTDGWIEKWKRNCDQERQFAFGNADQYGSARCFRAGI